MKTIEGINASFRRGACPLACHAAFLEAGVTRETFDARFAELDPELQALVRDWAFLNRDGFDPILEKMIANVEPVWRIEAWLALLQWTDRELRSIHDACATSSRLP